MGGGQGLSPRDKETVYIVTGCEKRGDEFVYTVSQAPRWQAEDLQTMNMGIIAAEKEGNEEVIEVLKRNRERRRGYLEPFGTFVSKQSIELESAIESNKIKVVPIKTKLKG
jgi:hypothetical protein